MPEEMEKLVCADEMIRSHRRWFKSAACLIVPVVVLSGLGLIPGMSVVLWGMAVVGGYVVAMHTLAVPSCLGCQGKLKRIPPMSRRVFYKCTACGTEFETDVAFDYLGSPPRKIAD